MILCTCVVLSLFYVYIYGEVVLNYNVCQDCCW